MTDLDYVCMDGGDDFVPDIYYGRIPVNNTYDALTIGMFDAIWPNPGLRFVFPEDSIITQITPTPPPTYELGQILEVGMVRMQETWGIFKGRKGKISTTTEVTRKLFHLFGDPSMQVYTSCPINIQTPEVYRVEDTIYVKVKDDGGYTWSEIYNMQGSLVSISRMGGRLLS